MSKLTRPQVALLEKLRKNAAFVRGSDVQVARALERLGFVRLTDNGRLSLGGRSDGERWFAERRES